MYHIHLNKSNLSRLLFASVLVLAVLGSMLIALPRDTSQAAEDHPAPLDMSNASLTFIVNEGQSDADVAFLAPSPGGGLFFTSSEVVFSLPVPENTTYVTRLAFANTTTTEVSGYDPQDAFYNFFLGDDPAQWRTNVPSYAGVRYHNLYPGIDVRFEGTQGMLKSTYVVSAGADTSTIAYRYTASEQMTVDDATGDLHILLDEHAEYGTLEIIERAPVAWQTIDGVSVPVDVRFEMSDTGHVGFALGEYDPGHALIIDPNIQYSTYFGGFFNEIGYAIVADDSGNGYLAGSTNSTTMPRKDAYQDLLNQTGTGAGSTSDAFIAKLNVSISAQKLIYGTYLGGGQQDEARGIAIDDIGNMYITGFTTSSNFPTTGTPFQSNNAGNGDGFVAKLSADGSTLIYGTYLGGGGADVANSIAIDTSGNAYIAGTTSSATFPDVNAIQPSLNGTQDAFVIKLTGDGSGAVYSTFLGGSGIEEGLDIDLDSLNRPHVVGHTDSLDFPTYAEAPNLPYQGAKAGATDGFVTRLLADGSNYSYSTYFGGGATDQTTGIVVDSTDDTAFITGWTTSTDLPKTGNALQPANAGAEDAFIAHLDIDGKALLYGTYIGGSSVDKAADITQDPQGIVHIAGETRSTDLIPPTLTEAQLLPDIPVPPDVVSQIGGVTQYTFDTYHGGLDAFAIALDLSTNSYFYAAYIGGFDVDDLVNPSDVPDDRALAMAVDAAGGIYITGVTSSASFPLANAAFQLGGPSPRTEAFLVKIGSAQADLVIEKTSDVPEVLVGENVTYTIAVTNNGPATTNNIVFEDSMPPEGSVQSINATPGTTCSQVGQLITCETTTLAATETATVTVVVTALSKGLVENTALITQSSEFDPDTSEESNSATATVVYYKDADLSIDVSGSTHRPYANQTIDLIVEVTNLGLAPDANVVVTDSLPTGQLSYVTHSTSQGTYNQLTGVWTIGPMDRDQVETLTITVTIGDHPIGTEIQYPASVTGVENDPDPLNNADTADLVVVGEYFPPYGCFPSETDPGVTICITGSEN